MDSLSGPTPVHDIRQDLVIIVGKGKGSVDNEQVLRPTAITMLEREYGILAKDDRSNAGRLIIDAEGLKTFVSSTRNIWFDDTYGPYDHFCS